MKKENIAKLLLPAGVAAAGGILLHNYVLADGIVANKALPAPHITVPAISVAAGALFGGFLGSVTPFKAKGVSRSKRSTYGMLGGAAGVATYYIIKKFVMKDGMLGSGVQQQEAQLVSGFSLPFNQQVAQTSSLNGVPAAVGHGTFGS